MRQRQWFAAQGQHVVSTVPQGDAINPQTFGIFVFFFARYAHVVPETFESLDYPFQEQTPIRASSLFITLYGDAIEPHGWTVWLGSLIQLLEPIGIIERLTRTSISA